MDFVQAITWIRTDILRDILLEFEEDILYWRGKDIARSEQISSIHVLQRFFLQNGLGILDFTWMDSQKVRIGITNTPLATCYEKAARTIQLECGLITEALHLHYQTGTTGTAHWIVPVDQEPYIEVTVTLEDPRE